MINIINLLRQKYFSFAIIYDTYLICLQILSMRLHDD